MTDNTYNGWRNRATWAIGLHLMDHVVSCILDDVDEWSGDPGENNLMAAAQMFRELVDDQVELADLPMGGLLMDLIDTSDVDWYALGRHALETALYPAWVAA